MAGSGALPGSSRWRLHRGGIVNIWQYGERFFDLSGGRVILQGTNGSGKSRTLELLLPLCLDGELRYLGAKGYDTVSIRRLMLDDYFGGPNRIGYAWIELRREIPGHGEEFLTAGIGVKASKTTQEVVNSWRFVTPARVGTDFELADLDKTPLDQKELKDRIGADAVMDESGPMQQLLARTVYGIDDARRYEDLLHLLRTLRNPDVGVKAVEGQLEEYLSRALPPLDHEVITRLATQFQDLESIRENMRRLRLADQSLSRFLAVYAQYTMTAIREGAEAVTQAQQSLAAHTDAASMRNQELHRERAARDKAHDDYIEQGRLGQSLDRQIRELDANQEYGDLNARRQVVDALRASADSALRNAATCRSAENTAVDTVRSALLGVQRASRAADQATDDARDHFGRAELDPGLLPAPPAAPSPEVVCMTESIQVDASPDAAPVQVERMTPPALDLDALKENLELSAAQAKRAADFAAERRVLAVRLGTTARELEQQHKGIATLKARAEDAAGIADRATADRLAAAQEASQAARGWMNQVRDWLDSAPATNASLSGPPLLPSDAELITDSRHAGRVQAALQEWASPAITHARESAAAADSELKALQPDRSQLSGELDALGSGAYPQPPPVPCGPAERAGRPGAAFFQLVAFRPGLPHGQRTGLEAALQASGLLNAWVTPDGKITDPGLQDLLADPGAAPPGTRTDGTLSAVLIPELQNDCPVATNVVAQLLASVGLTDRPVTAAPSGLAVSLTGRWRAGNLVGFWAKETAEYVGASTREANRQRRITELLSLLKNLDGQMQAFRQRSEDAKDQIAAWEKHVRDFPDTAPVVAAQTLLGAAEQAEREAQEQADKKIGEHAAAEGRWQASRGELSREASEANLPDTADALAERLTDIRLAIAATDALHTSVTEQYLTAASEIARPLAAYDAAVDARKKGEVRASARYEDYATAEKALAVHVGSLGIDSQEFDRKLSQMRGNLAALQANLPSLQETHEKAKAKVVRLETLQEAEKPEQQKRQTRLAEAERQFDAAVGATGVWAAATGDSQAPPPADRDYAVQTATSWHSDTREADIINAFQVLRTSLPAGYDATVLQDGGLLAVLVSDGDGRRPVVTLAKRTAERLAGYQEQLNTRYQEIFEEFLLRDLAERLRQQIDAADDLCARMNAILARAQSSQGVHVHLSWDPSAVLDDAAREALTLVRKSLATRTREEDARLRRALQDRIEAERDSHDAHYTEVLARALDYRDWYAFTVRVRDTGPDGQPRSRPLRRLSSGETRLVSYVTLFAAAAAFYDALTTAGNTPLRLVLLDEAFERLDDPTTTRLLELLAELDTDWVITWPGGSAFSPKIDRMHVYDIFRPKAAPGMAFVHTTWDGSEARRHS